MLCLAHKTVECSTYNSNWILFFILENKNDPVCIFQYSVVKIALGRELLLAAKERRLKDQATFSGRRTANLEVKKRAWRGPSSVSERSVVLAIRGLFGRESCERF